MREKHNILRTAIFLFLSMVMMFSLMSSTAKAEGEASYTHDMSTNAIVFTESGIYTVLQYDSTSWNPSADGVTKVAETGTPVTITGTSSIATIAVLSGTHDITLSDVSITDTNTSNTYGAFYIASGTANVTIADGTTNTFTAHGTAIAVGETATLNIDGGAANTGILKAEVDGSVIGSGIGSFFNYATYTSNPLGTINISGATIYATAYSGGAAIGGSGGAVTIQDNAVIYATSAGSGAAIGGAGNGSATAVTITGTAKVDAKNTAANGGGVAIGGGIGSDTGAITISGNAVVTATSTTGTAIGGGNNTFTSTTQGASGTILITDNASVTASGATNGVTSGAGIGCGTFYKGDTGTITISGNANVTATGNGYAAGIGSSQCSSVHSITIATTGNVTASGGNGIYDGNGGAAIGSGYYGFVDTINITSGNITATGGMNSAVIGGGCESYGGNITITGDAKVVAIPYSANPLSYAGYAIGNGAEGTGYYSVGTTAVVKIEKAENFVAYYTSITSENAINNTGDVGYIQLAYNFASAKNGVTTIKNGDTVVATFDISNYATDGTYYGIVIAVPDKNATYTVYYDDVQQMHSNTLSDGQLSTEFVVKDGFGYYTDVKNAEFATITSQPTNQNLTYLAGYTWYVFASVSDYTSYDNNFQWQVQNAEGEFVDIATDATSFMYSIPTTTPVGTYYYRAVITTTSKYNNGIPKTQVISNTATVVISPKELTDVTTNLKESYYYTGSEITENLEVKNGDTVLTSDTDYTVAYSDNIGAGTATVTISLKGNYSGTVTKTFEIIYNENLTTSITDIFTNDLTNWTNQTVSLTTQNGWTASTTGTDFANTATVSTEGTTTETIFVKDSAGNVYKTTVTYNLDQTPATGAIKIDTDSWGKFLETITFGVYKAKAATVTITGEDTLSGMNGIEYYVADSAKTLEEIAAITTWTTYKEFSISAEEAKTCVVYAKLKDNAGNITFLSSNGVVFDITAPVITGVKNLSFYASDLKIEVVDNNLDTVTLNGKTVGSTIEIKADTNQEYIIVATDKVGLSTTVKFTTYVENAPVDEVLDSILSSGTITETDKETINNLANEVISNVEKEAAKDDEATVATLNKLDEAFLAANGNINVVPMSPSIAAGVDEERQVTIAAIVPQGLAIAVYGSDEAVTTSNIDLGLSVEQLESDSDKLVFNVKPIVSVDGGDWSVIANEDIQSPVTFRLYVNDSFKGTVTTVEHVKQDGTSEIYENLSIQTDDIGKYVELTVSEFSNFIINEGLYKVTVDGVVSSYKATETVTLDIPTKDGYEFVGWESEEVEITDNSFVMPEYDVTVVSVWEEIDTTSTEGTPNTGDNTNALIFVLLAIISVVGIASLYTVRKRKRK